MYDSARKVFFAGHILGLWVLVGGTDPNKVGEKSGCEFSLCSSTWQLGSDLT